MLFKTPNKMNKPKAYPQAGEENPSTACRNPKKRHLTQGKTGVILLVLIASLVLVSITFLPRPLPPVSPPVSQPNMIFQEPFNQTYGGSGWDEALDLVQTTDGGFALAGYTSSFGAGKDDFWLVKTTANCTVEWHQTYGGPSNDHAFALVQTTDGGFALAGFTESFGAGKTDMWLMKTTTNGTIEWHQTYGGPGYDRAFALIQTTEGGFALAGYTPSSVTSESSNYDFWLVKTTANGTVEWHQTYGGSDWDYALALVQTTDGGFALAGFTESFGAGESDMWLVKTDATGMILWHQSYGGPEEDGALALVQTVDGGFALAGFTESFGVGNTTMWLVKTGATGMILWHQTYGSPEGLEITAIIQTADRGFALAGGIGLSHEARCGICDSFYNNTDMLLLKTDANGVITWHQFYRGPSYDHAFALIQTTDGGFALAGYTSSFGAGEFDMWLVITNATGFLQSSSSTTTPLSTPTLGWGPVTLLVAVVVLATWHRRRKRLE